MCLVSSRIVKSLERLTCFKQTCKGFGMKQKLVLTVNAPPGNYNIDILAYMNEMGSSSSCLLLVEHECWPQMKWQPSIVAVRVLWSSVEAYLLGMCIPNPCYVFYQ